jgi:hypothetical protein
MNGRELASVVELLIIAAVVVYLAYVIRSALQSSTGNIFARLTWLKVIDFALKIARPKRPDTKEIPDEPSNADPVVLSHRRAFVILGMALVLGLTVTIWWYRKPVLWRVHIAREFNKLSAMLFQDTQQPIVVLRGKDTLDQIAATVDSLTERMKRNPYKPDTFWVLDHHWEYWNTDALEEYRKSNMEFVASGGSIRRMFLLTEEELRKPAVQRVLQQQCKIGQVSPNQTGTGFELWQADPNQISKREEYQELARSFQQLPDTGENFTDFDIVQFDGALYYSSDFSPDYRVMGRSIWLFDSDTASKVNLKSLFKKSIAHRVPCDQSVLRADITLR